MKRIFSTHSMVFWLRNREKVLAIIRISAILVILHFLFLPAAQSRVHLQDTIPQPAAAEPAEYLPLLEGKRVGLVVNHTSLIGGRHLADSLLQLGVTISAIFSPEHGFRGTAPDGQFIGDQNDPFSGTPIISLYGKKKKPSDKDLDGVDILVFDIQDVGTRFYTYISTMHLVMEACAENGIPMIVLDRPNPNGHYIDGPVLDTAFSSFVGMHPIPAVHGLTVGELALMINGEGWLDGGLECELTVIPCIGYTHSIRYDLDVNPSPNLPDMRAIYLYPTLCFFEGTTFSVGRGTDAPFQQLGHPALQNASHRFTPAPNAGSAYPKHEGVSCGGLDFRSITIDSLWQQGTIDVELILSMYRSLPEGTQFFRSDGYFDLLAGTDSLRLLIESGADATEIRESWGPALENYRRMRVHYLLYPD